MKKHEGHSLLHKVTNEVNKRFYEAHGIATPFVLLQAFDDDDKNFQLAIGGNAPDLEHMLELVRLAYEQLQKGEPTAKSFSEEPFK